MAINKEGVRVVLHPELIPFGNGNPVATLGSTNHHQASTPISLHRAVLDVIQLASFGTAVSLYRLYGLANADVLLHGTSVTSGSAISPWWPYVELVMALTRNLTPLARGMGSNPG